MAGLSIGCAISAPSPVAGPLLSASISGLTGNAAFGPAAQIGTALTGAVSGLEGGEAVVHAWTLDGVPVSGAASAAYTPAAGDDLGLLRYAPSVNGQSVLSAAYTVRHAPPAADAAPAAGGDPVIGESLSGTAGTFTGADLAAVTNEWQISDDGATGWAGTGDTDTTGPAMASGRHYRLASTTSNSGGALTTCSSAIGPAVAPVISMSGLTGGEAIPGDHASIAMAADQGTITARKWGSTSGGSEYGTGTNPTDFAAGEGGTLYATATVGGVDYTVPAGIAAPALDVTQNAGGTVDITMSEGTFSVTVSGSAISGHNGTHGPFDTADLDSGPVNVVPASISGTAEAGQVLTAVPGLWVWDTANGPIGTAAVWQSDDADITGETGTAYTTAGGDLGTAIEYQETATDSAGARVQDSNAIAIPAASGSLADQISAALGPKAIGVYDLTDFANIKQNTDGTGDVAAVSDPARFWADLSGNGNHIEGWSGTPAAGAGFVDQANTRMRFQTPPALSSAMEIYAVIDPDGDTDWMLLGKTDDAAYTAAYASSGGGSSDAGFSGTIVHTVNNTVVSPATAAGLHTAVTTPGGFAVQGVRGLDLTAESALTPMSFGINGLKFSGNIKAYVLCDVLTTGERANLQTILAGV